MDYITVLKYAHNMALIEWDKEYERAKEHPSEVSEAREHNAKDRLYEIRAMLLEAEKEEVDGADMEVIRCPKCGRRLRTMEPFYDTEENEWNYQCDDCGFDITIFVK